MHVIVSVTSFLNVVISLCVSVVCTSMLLPEAMPEEPVLLLSASNSALLVVIPEVQYSYVISAGKI